MFSPKYERKQKITKTMTPLNTNLKTFFKNNESKGIILLDEISEAKSENDFNKNPNKIMRKNETSLTKIIPKYKQKEIIQKITNGNTTFNKRMRRASSNLFMNNFSNLITQGNSFNSGIISNFSKNENSEKKIKKKATPVKNYINFVDRQRLKTSKLLGLKLYEQFEEEQREKDKKLKRNYSHSNTNNNSSEKIKYDYYNNSYLESSDLSNEVKKKFKSKKHINYSLQQLMKFNPYHYVSTRVRYNDAIEMKVISEKLSDVNSVKKNQASTYQNNFFKDKKINTKIIKTFKVNFNNNLSYKGGLIWRILNKLRNSNIPTEFKQICKFQGYAELWKHYGMLIEKLLLNYPVFKWFLEKEKYMDENVFREYLKCLKLDTNFDETFPNKVFILFDEGDGKANIKNFFFIMKLTSSTNDVNKFNFFIKLFEEESRKDMELCINVLNVFEILKNIVNFKEWKKSVKRLKENIRKEFNDDKMIQEDLYVSKKRMIDFLYNNKYIKTLFENFKKDYKFTYINYNEKINIIFNSTIRNIKKFLNKQSEISAICEHDVNNYEKVLQSVNDKRKSMKKLKKIINYIEGNDTEE